MTSTIYSIEQQKLMVMDVECWGEQQAEFGEGEPATSRALGERLWNFFDRLVLALGATAMMQHPCDDEALVYYHNWMLGS
jgi:hypothetical protein